MTYIINRDTPIGLLTVNQFMEFMNSEIKKDVIPTKSESSKRLVYGLRGIRILFNVSHATAQRYKDTIIKEAVYQSGRKIVVDAEMAMELFNQKQGGKK